MSVRILFITIISTEYSVKFLPIYLNPIYTGKALSTIFTRLNGSVIPNAD